MKKMYLALFLIVLVVFVFAGCLSFSGAIDTTTQYYEDENYQGENYTNAPVSDSVIPEQTTGAVSSEQTTAVSGSQESTTAGGNSGAAEATTSASVSSIPNPSIPTGTTEYDILKSGTFHMTGKMTDSSGMDAPMEIAITDNSIYMLSDFSGASMGMLISNDKVYMIYPDKSAYLELSDSIMSMAGLDIDELVNSDSINFSTYGNLTDAKSVTNEVANGRNCTVYHFTVEDGGETRVYMEGTKLVRLASYNSSGKFLTSTDVDAISGTVPSNKSAPPSNYKAYKGMTGMFSFMTLLEGVME